MDITIYLPDELGRRAKDQRVNLSGLLREALTTQFHEEDTMAAVLEGAQEIKLKLANENGNVYVGRITGKRIGTGDHVEVFLTDQENVVVYDFDNLKYYVENGEVALADMIGDQDVYLEVMDALGREAEVDLGV